MNYHFVQQEDWNDCGLACLAMLIENYQQKRVSLLQLKNQLTVVDENGLSFFHLIELGAKYQLSGEGYHCEIEMLNQNAHLCPMIINLQNQQGISHYVILNKIEDEIFYISDPSQTQGLIKLSLTELKTNFLNKILLFKKTGRWKPKMNLEFLFHWLKQFYLLLILLVFFALFANFFWLLSSGFIKIFSQWIINQQVNWWELAKFVFFVFLGCFFDFCQDYFGQFLSQKTWNQILIHFLNQKPEAGIEERILHHSLITLKENLEFIQFFWTVIINSLVSIIFIPILEIWISRINPIFCFLPMIWMILILFGKIFVKKKIPEQKLKLKFDSLTYQKSLNQYFNFQKDLQKRGLKKSFFKKLQIQSEKTQNTSRKIYHWQILLSFWQKFWVKIFYFILLVIVYFSLQNKSFNDGDLLYLIILSNYLLSLANQTTDSWLDWFLVKNQQQELKKSIQNDENNSFSLTQVEEISFTNFILESQTELILTINQKFSTSFFVEGDESITKKFFQLMTDFSSKRDWIKVNQQSWTNFENDFFILEKNAHFLPGTLAENLFNWNPDLDPKIFNVLKPLAWLEKYQIDFLKQDSCFNLNLQQKQIVNFLSAFFSLSKIFVFENCLSELNLTDEEELLKLFLELKADSFVIFFSQHLSLERNFCQKLVLNPMI